MNENQNNKSHDNSEIMLNYQLGQESYRELVDGNMFIDKSFFISEFINQNTQNMLITRPRRWGKTLAMSMLQNFFAAQVDEFGNVNSNEQNRDFGIFQDKIVVAQDKIDIEMITKLLTKEQAVKVKETKVIDDLIAFLRTKNHPLVKRGKIESELSNNSIYLSILDKLYQKLTPIFDTVKRDQPEKDISKQIEKIIEELKCSDNNKYNQLLSSFGNTCKHFKRYPVIFITFRKLEHQEYWKKQLKQNISEAFQGHEYMIDVFQNIQENSKSMKEIEKAIENQKLFSDFLYRKTDILEDSLKFLSKVLYEHYKIPPILIIDEYDAPIFSSCQKPHFEEVNLVIRGILGQVCKGNQFVSKVVLTGVTRLAKSTIFSDINNLKEISIFSKTFSEAFGFTSEEVNYLIEQRNKNRGYQVKVDFRQLQKWYNGYLIGGKTIFNPWSIINCLSSDEDNIYEPYWIESGSIVHLANIFEKLADKEQALILLDNETITFVPNKAINFESIENGNINEFFSYLAMTGYLTLDSQKKGPNDEMTFRIPNNEVKKYYYSTLLPAFIKKNLGQQFDLYLQEIVDNLGSLEGFKESLQTKYLDKLTSEQMMSELSFQSVIYTLAHLSQSSPYIPIMEKLTTFKQRVDTVFLPSNNNNNQTAVIHEYKIGDETELHKLTTNALWQICANLYLDTVKLGKYKDLNLSWEYVILRAIVFYRSKESWKVNIEQFQFTLKEVTEIMEIFSDNGQLLANRKRLISQEKEQQEFLGKISQKSISNFLQSHSKSSKSNASLVSSTPKSYFSIYNSSRTIDTQRTWNQMKDFNSQSILAHVSSFKIPSRNSNFFNLFPMSYRISPSAQVKKNLLIYSIAKYICKK